MTGPKWVTIAIVTAIHDEALYEFGGLTGVRERGLLESALDRPHSLFAYEPDSSIFALAASLCIGLAKNHPFNDGNKRTALLATRAFLYLNGQELEPSQESEVITMVSVADGSLSEAELADWLQSNSNKRI